MPVGNSAPGFNGHRNATRGPWRIETAPIAVSSAPGQDAVDNGQPSYSSPPSPQPSPPLTPPDSTERATGTNLDKLLSQQQGPHPTQLLKDLLPIMPPSSTLPLSPTTPSASSSPGLHRTATLKSRNDIFGSAPSTPRRPPPSSVAMSRFSTCNDAASPSVSPANSTKNSLFFDTPTSSPSFAVRRDWSSGQDAVRGGRAGHAIQDSHAMDAEAFPSEAADDLRRRQSLGRSNTEERERERLRIRQSKEVDFRLAPSREFLLGEGRHCDVFLGAYRRRYGSLRNAAPPSDWQLCAVKRLHPDRQSQLLGLDEAFALRRLGPNAGIVKLIDIRDEVLAVTSPMPTPALDKTSLDSSVSSNSTIDSNSTLQSPSLMQGRTSSDAWQDSEPAHLRNGHGTDKAQAPRASNEGSEDDLPPSAAALQAAGYPRVDLHRSATEHSLGSLAAPAGSSSTDPPRLLILLELLPLSLATYSQRHSSRIDVFFWLHWACELAATLEWMHGKGCVHCDIKPENILLDHNLRTKLCDFNSAFFPNASTSPLTDGLGLGTPAYGAPELTKRGKSGDVVSFPVDIFSLGALLYSLATGVEPMARAKSMIEMLHRKERFFLTEENDRIARISVAEGWGDSSSNAGSTNASRHTSLRRKSKDGSATKRSSRRRDSSADSIESTASSITTKSGKTPSLAAIQLLLEPSSLAGVLVPPDPQRRSAGAGDAREAGHHRALSLHKNYAPHGKSPSEVAAENPGSAAITRNGAQKTGVVPKPSVLRRTISYGGAKEPEAEEGEGTNTEDSTDLDLSLALTASFAEVSREKYRLEEEYLHGAGSNPQNGSSPIRPRVSAHARGASLEATGTPLKWPASGFHHKTSSLPSHSRPIGSTGREDEDEDEREEEEDRSPYRDGSPALLLPGGGKLPQSALDLLEHMLLANPLRRPKASEVRRRLEAIREETLRALK
ncbi:kinase-like protein [Microstroma glucosiphilum]|uniref:Kinase-like protein n=1 Tax=Pseudomicrostroma glucosiphilum TaxID=1684307 RepID=A0A316TY92_9BASI|nr:kinase-like protein [Pseudomicrostroma glucosiphilum]PWN18137.1 kinase-like protein [Pseudomicrostroma glucosiphilum]